MVMRTEEQLWSTLKRNMDGHGVDMTRIETSTVDGVSDVEYVTRPYHGWLELKVAPTNSRKGELRLSHQLTLEQYRWLLRHDNVTWHLRSWVLVGLGGNARWRGFLLVPAMYAWPVCGESARPHIKDLDDWHCPTVEDVFSTLKGETGSR